MTTNQTSRKFYQWIKEGKSGCIFARLFALKRAEPWESIVIPGEQFDEKLPHLLNEHFQRAAIRSEAIQFLFPQIKTAAQIVHLIQVLCSSTDWHCTEITPKDGESTTTLLVGLRWDLPDKKHVNWVLGFADLDTMPPTRRTPTTAIVLRLGEPGRAPSIGQAKPDEVETRKKDRGRIPVHLADMPVDLSDEAIKKTWEKTKETTHAILGSHPENRGRAHAKITFSLPLVCKDKLKSVLRPATAVTPEY